MTATPTTAPATTVAKAIPIRFDLVYVDGTVERLKCDKCRKLLAERITPPYLVRCTKCKHVNEAAAVVTGTS